MISIPTYRSPLGRCSAPAIVHLSSIVRRPAELRPRRAAARAGTAANHASADAARADAAPAAAADGAARRYARLLHFAADGINPPKVEVCEQLPGGGGRGLVAAADVPAGGVLLSVPLDRVFTSQADPGMHWAVEMGMRLLEERHAAAQGAAAAAAGAGPSGSTGASSSAGASAGAGKWRDWVACLPERVVTPLEMSEDQVARLGVPYTIRDVLNMQETLRRCYEERRPRLAAAGCGWDDLLWAVQVLHSRCFFDPSMGLHLSVPGVDMANDRGDAANATVRVVHSPDAVQGAAALEEVAPVDPEAAGKPPASFFQLVAGDDGVSAGDEVSISYGHQWPAEPYFLLFGFVPERNPSESVVIYSDLWELAGHYCELHARRQRSGDTRGRNGGGGGGAEWDAEAAAAALREWCAERRREELREEEDEAAGPEDAEAPPRGAPLWRRVAERAEALAEAAADGGGGGGGGYERLVVTPGGLDGRLAAAVELAAAATAAEAAAASGSGGGGEGFGQLSMGDLVVDRLGQLLAALSTPPPPGNGAAAASGGSSGGGGGGARAEELVEEYRRAKLEVVTAALRAMAPRAA